MNGLRLYFPALEPWVARSMAGSSSCCLTGQLQLCPPHSTIHHLAGSASRHLAKSPLHPGNPSLPLLLVWMNVSSLSPRLSDFHTVQISVSSGCFLFLNCCCPSFGCARRHNVSTYSSILAGSMVYDLFNVLLHAVFQYIVEDFSVCVHQSHWPEVFFLCYLFVWVWR